MSEGKQTAYELTPEQVAAIEKAINHGDRVELLPLKDRVKILRIRRDEIAVKS